MLDGGTAHQGVIEAFGGTAGIRDRGLLESALYRPLLGYYETLEEMAATLFESLLINHPFVGGQQARGALLRET